MKKNVLLSSAVFFILFFLGCGKQPGPFDGPLDPNTTTYDGYVVALNDDFDADIVVLGNDKYIDPRLNHRVVDRLSEENLQYDDAVHGYQAIVILNMDGSIKLEQKDFDFLYDYVVNKNKDVLYYGTAYSAYFEQMFSNSPSNEFPALALFGSWPNGGGRQGYGCPYGFWTKEALEELETSGWGVSFSLAYLLNENASAVYSD